MGTYQGTPKIRAKKWRIKSQKLIMHVVLELPDKLPFDVWEKIKEKSEKYEKSEKKVSNEKYESYSIVE